MPVLSPADGRRAHALLSAGALLVAYALAGCSGEDVADLKPKLVVKQGTPTDGHGHYVLDFGNVGTGTTASLPLWIEDEAKVPLTLQPVAVSAPFGTDAVTAQLVHEEGNLQIMFSFSPVSDGPAELQVELVSDGGDATVILEGNGVAPPCTFAVDPPSLAFGAVAVGQSSTASFQVANTGTNPCVVAQIAFSPTTDPAFTIPSLPSLPLTLAPGDQISVGVLFSPGRPGLSLGGQANVTDEAGTTASVLLTGSSPISCATLYSGGSCLPQALQQIYLNDTTALYSYDPQTVAVTTIGQFSGPETTWAMFDIAINQQGVMVGVSGGVLYVIDPTTAACTELADTSDPLANGLTFNPDGRVMVAGSMVQLYDFSTGGFTQVVPSGEYTTSGDVVELPNGLIYWTVVGNSGSDQLLTLNPSTGVIAPVGDTGFVNIWGLSYANNVLYGFTVQGQVLTIDPATAQSTGVMIGGNWYGAATNPYTWE